MKAGSTLASSSSVLSSSSAGTPEGWEQPLLVAVLVRVGGLGSGDALWTSLVADPSPVCHDGPCSTILLSSVGSGDNRGKDLVCEHALNLFEGATAFPSLLALLLTSGVLELRVQPEVARLNQNFVSCVLDKIASLLVIRDSWRLWMVRLVGVV